MCRRPMRALQGHARGLGSHMALPRALVSEANPDGFTPAMHQGIACALNADPTRTYWGYSLQDTWTEEKAKLYGCIQYGCLSPDVQNTVDNIRNPEVMSSGELLTAREVMENLTAKEEGVTHRMPKVISKPIGQAPEEPNAYSDGSLKNTKGVHWGIGGAGVW